MKSRKIGMMYDTPTVMSLLLDVLRSTPVFRTDCVVLMRKKSGWRQNAQGVCDTYRPSHTDSMSIVDAIENDDVLAIYPGSFSDVRRAEVWVQYKYYVSSLPHLCDGDIVVGKVLMGQEEHVDALTHDICTYPGTGVDND